MSDDELTELMLLLVREEYEERVANPVIDRIFPVTEDWDQSDSFFEERIRWTRLCPPTAPRTQKDGDQ